MMKRLSLELGGKSALEFDNANLVGKRCEITVATYSSKLALSNSYRRLLPPNYKLICFFISPATYIKINQTWMFLIIRRLLNQN